MYYDDFQKITILANQSGIPKLIIDDAIIICNAIKSHYTQKGYYVKSSSYQEFQDNVTLEKFDLILLDLNLKDIKGLDLLKSARDTRRRGICGRCGPTCGRWLPRGQRRGCWPG